jgi:hypothetical protein
VESITPPSASKDKEAWNEAYDRLVNFLNTFALSNRAQVSELALILYYQAQDLHQKDPSPVPVTQAMAHTQKRLADWLAANLGEERRSASHILATGYIALLLSQVHRTAPDAVLANPLPEELRQALRETLLVTGPDLKISSMTPRHLDYGPMLQFARQTWHRWDAKELFIALLFWAGVYTAFYWWLSQRL